MTYEVPQNPFPELVELAKREAVEHYGDESGFTILNSEALAEDPPAVIRDLVEKIAVAVKGASANPPERGEYHVDDVVNINIPHSHLLHIIYSLQAAANEAARDAQRMAESIQKTGEALPTEIKTLFLNALEEAMQRYLEYTHIGNALNQIRLAARPLVLPDPHGLGANPLSDGDQEDIAKLGDINDISDLLGPDYRDGENNK